MRILITLFALSIALCACTSVEETQSSPRPLAPSKENVHRWIEEIGTFDGERLLLPLRALIVNLTHGEVEGAVISASRDSNPQRRSNAAYVLGHASKSDAAKGALLAMVNDPVTLHDRGIKFFGGYDAGYMTRDLENSMTVINGNLGGSALRFQGDVGTDTEVDGFLIQGGGGVTFSGGEPLMQPDFLLALLNQCRALNIHTAVDTSCYAEPEIAESVAERADLFLCDLKHMDNEMHERFTGVGNKLILDNIRLISQADKKIVIRIPIIPGFNDNPENIEASGKFAASLSGVGRIDILPFNRGGMEKSTRLTGEIKSMQIETPGEEQISSIAKSLSKYVFEVNIGG